MQKGIRHSYKVTRNQQEVLDVRNHVALSEGLYPYEPIETPVASPAADGTHPFPQIFRGPSYTLLFQQGAVYRIDDSAGTTWGQTLLVTIDPITEQTVTIPSSGIWHVALFQNGWIACNGACMVFQEDVPVYASAGAGTVYCETDSYPLSICELRGRVFSGGVEKYYNRINSWQYSIDMFGETLPEMDNSWVGWGSIQGDDTFWNVWPDRMVSSYAGRLGVEELSQPNPTVGSPWGYQAGWAHSASTAIATATTASLSYNMVPADGLEAETWYMLEVEVSGYTGGTAVIGFTSDEDNIGELLPITSIGKFRVYVQTTSIPDDLAIQITGTVAFTAVISSFRLSKVYMDKEKFNTFREHKEREQQGFSPTSDGGENLGKVLAVKPLHEHVIAYGEDSIWIFSPSSNPIPTYGKTKLADFGIIGRGGVGGNLDVHILVDKLGRVWTLNNNLELNMRGYQEVFENAIVDSGLSTLSISWDNAQRHAYITADVDGDSDFRTFILTETGLTRIDTEIVTSLAGTREVGAVSHTLVGLSHDGDSDAFLFESDVIDMGIPGVKMLESIRIHGDAVTTLRACVYHRVQNNGAFIVSDYQDVDLRGESNFFLSGIDFKIGLTAEVYGNIKIDAIDLTYAVDGRTSAREFLTRVA